MPPGLIFDYDGLMVDSELMLAECVIDAIAHFGGAVTVQDFGHLFGSTEMNAEWDRLLATWCKEPVTLTDLWNHITPVVVERGDALPLMPGVAELIEEAKAAGWRVGLGTGQSWARLEARLRRNNVFECFDAIVSAGDVARGKPAPDVFLEVARRLGVDAADCIVLEDSLPGCEAALAAGMGVVVCPSLVSAHCPFPDGIRRVESLTELTIADLAER